MSTEIEKIKLLREETGLSLNEIKRALAESGGDEVKARSNLANLGQIMAAKKSSREVKEGVISSYIHANAKIGSMIELLCETDFVAKNQEFTNLAHDIALQVVAMKPGDEAELMSQPFIKDPSLTILDLINQVVGKLGENIKLGRFELFEI